MSSPKEHYRSPDKAESSVFQPDYQLVRRNLRDQVRDEVGTLLQAGNLEQKIRSLFLGNSQVDVQTLLSLDLPPSQSVAAAAILEHIIEERWKMGAQEHILWCDPESVDLGVFVNCRKRPYEHMPTKVLPGAVWGGIGKLLIQFNPGAEEDEEPHRHPGGRLLFSTGHGEFRCYSDQEKSVDIERGMVILMPKRIWHNFAAGPKESWQPLSFHVSYAGTGKRAIEYQRDIREDDK